MDNKQKPAWEDIPVLPDQPETQDDLMPPIQDLSFGNDDAFMPRWESVEGASQDAPEMDPTLWGPDQELPAMESEEHSTQWGPNQELPPEESEEHSTQWGPNQELLPMEPEEHSTQWGPNQEFPPMESEEHSTQWGPEQSSQIPVSSDPVVYPVEEPAWESPSPIVEEFFVFSPTGSSPDPESGAAPQWEAVPTAPLVFDPVPEAAEPEPDLERDILSDPTLMPPEPPAPVQEEITDAEYRDDPPAPADTSAKQKNADTRPTLKGRPKRKKGEGFFGIPNILVTGVWLALILTIGVTLGRMLWICAADVLAFGREDKQVTITVYESDSMEDVVNKLHDAGLIRYKSLFNLYASISDAEEEIKPGIYDLNTRYDYHALVNSMSPSSSREVIELTIPEGYTCRQIFALLEDNRVCTAQDIAAYAADGALPEYWFLEGLERGSEYCLEGYLFPDTYQFYKNSTPREALEKMLNNFDHRFSEEMRSRIDELNANVTDGTYGIREVVIVASLIEKESAAPAESPTIASVIYNRLFNWDYPPLLNIDAAIVYAQGGEAEHIDTSIDSPYNTYRNTGLTPTAISNPGLASLKAALKPEKTDYYYYVLNPGTGMHQFSKTQAEHDAWIDEFYN